MEVPGFSYNQERMERFLNREDAASGEVSSDELNLLLGLLGLPLQGESGGNKQGYAMRYPLADVNAFRVPALEAESTAPRGASLEVMP